MSLVTFLVTISLVLWSCIFPFHFRRNNNNNNNSTLQLFPVFPVLGSLLLAAACRVDPVRVIVGDGKVQPYATMLIFFSPAVLCMTLDQTGLLRWVSVSLCSRAHGSGRRLFGIVFLCSSLLTVFTSNDIVVLTLTPIVVSAASPNPRAFLFAMFFSANVLSILFIIGNPTNTIVGQAMGLDFLGYARWMVFPAFFTCAALFVSLWVYFRHDLARPLEQQQHDQPQEQGREVILVDRAGARVHSCILALSLVVFSVSGFLKTPLWAVALGSALLSLAYSVTRLPLLSVATSESPHEHLVSLRAWALRVSHARAALIARDSGCPENKVPSLSGLIRSLPWSILPFAAGMFILVDSLVVFGWVDDLAEVIIKMVGSSVVAASFVMLLVTVFGCNLLNNQPATILFSRILLTRPFLEASQHVKTASMLAIIVGANLAANITVIGALAGLLFSGICKEKGASVSASTFSRVGTVVMAPVLVAAGLSIWAMAS